MLLHLRAPVGATRDRESAGEEEAQRGQGEGDEGGRGGGAVARLGGALRARGGRGGAEEQGQREGRAGRAEVV